jgi:hypothetical protein
LENVSLRSLLAMFGTSQRLAFVPLTNTVLLLGAPVQPTWWVKILTYLQSERFLFIIYIYKSEWDWLAGFVCVVAWQRHLHNIKSFLWGLFWGCCLAATIGR